MMDTLRGGFAWLSQLARAGPSKVAAGRLPAGPRLATTMVHKILPEVASELANWQEMAERIPNPALREQALASLTSKRFHCQGGAVLALLGGEQWRQCVSFIVALQTISDFLDNLSDRNGQYAAASLRRLHLAMVDAADPPLGPNRRGPYDYYTLYPWQDDGGYLASLVDVCTDFVAHHITSQPLRSTGRQLALMYRHLQVAKHSPPPERLDRLSTWCRKQLAPDSAGPATAVRRAALAGTARRPPVVPAVSGDGPDGLHWPEFAAACGSTLALFALYCSAAAEGKDARSTQTRTDALLQAYFPWINGLHILLDYLIDQHEDVVGGDLNLTACYEAPELVEQRLPWMVRRARQAAAELPGAEFHLSVVDGLLGLYLSDPKVERGGLRPIAAKLLRTGGGGAMALHAVCGGLRRSGLA